MIFLVSSVQSLSCVQLFVTPWTALQASLSITTSRRLLTCPEGQWCHPTISSLVVPFSSCRQSFLASGSLTLSQFFTSSGQSIGASASVIPMNIQDFPFMVPWKPSWGVFMFKKKEQKPFIYKVWFPGQQWSTISGWFCTLGIRGYLL